MQCIIHPVEINKLITSVGISYTGCNGTSCKLEYLVESSCQKKDTFLSFFPSPWYLPCSLPLRVPLLLLQVEGGQEIHRTNPTFLHCLPAFLRHMHAFPTLSWRIAVLLANSEISLSSQDSQGVGLMNFVLVPLE